MQARPVGLSVAKNPSFFVPYTHTPYTGTNDDKSVQLKLMSSYCSCTRFLLSVSDRPAGRMRGLASRLQAFTGHFVQAIEPVLKGNM